MPLATAGWIEAREKAIFASLSASDRKACAERNVKRLWRLWAKALGEKASAENTEADKIALVRSFIVLIYIITNFVIIAGVIRHWNQ